MRAISSLRDITMRVLIVSALFACAAAAPYHLSPVLPYAAAVLPGYAVIPPAVPAGDIQGAVIDAQVKAADNAQVLVDQARALVEIASENQNEGVLKANDLVKEKTEEAFWAAEEQKWQALNAAQVAEARNAALAAANEGAVEAAVAAEPVAEEAKPEAAVKSEAIEVKAEEKEAVVKSAEVEKPVEAVEGEKKDDGIAAAKSALDKALEAQAQVFNDYNAALIKSAAVAPIIPAVSAFNYNPVVAPVAYPAAYRTFPVSHIQAVPGYYPPTLVKSVW